MTTFPSASTAAARGIKIVRREQRARSRQHLGVLSEVIYESDAVDILRIELGTGGALESIDLGKLSAFHFVIEGTPVFRASNASTDLMPGDSIVFDDTRPYAILNRAPSRAVILSVAFKTCFASAGD